MQPSASHMLDKCSTTELYTTVELQKVINWIFNFQMLTINVNCKDCEPASSVTLRPVSDSVFPLVLLATPSPKLQNRKLLLSGGGTCL